MKRSRDIRELEKWPNVVIESHRNAPDVLMVYTYIRIEHEINKSHYFCRLELAFEGGNEATKTLSWAHFGAVINQFNQFVYAALLIGNKHDVDMVDPYGERYYILDEDSKESEPTRLLRIMHPNVPTGLVKLIKVKAPLARKITIDK